MKELILLDDVRVFCVDLNWLLLIVQRSPKGCRQYGCSSKPLLCHGESSAAQAGDHPRPGLHGEGASHPVLQVNALQAHAYHLL